MGYAKINIDSVLEANPGISVLDLAVQAAEDHARDYGCVFEVDAGPKAVAAVNLDPNGPASELSEESRELLAHELEARETFCPHKEIGVQAISATDGPECDHPVSEFIDAKEAFLRGVPKSVMESYSRESLRREAMEGRPLFGDKPAGWDGSGTGAS